MKQAKFALTAVAVLAVVGGALAFKANRQAKFFYRYNTSVIDGKVTGICDKDLTTTYLSTTVAAPAGTQITLSAAPAANVATCTANVVVGG